MGLLLLPACGKSGLGVSKDAATNGADVGADVLPTDSPPTNFATDSPPTSFEDMAPGMPDLAKTPDLAPGDPVGQSDLPILRDGPSDPLFFIDLPDVFTREVDPIDATKRDVTSPPDIPPDLPPVPDLQINLDKPPGPDLNPAPDELPPSSDGYSHLDDRGASDYCTSSGGTVGTQLCCTSASNFRDTCTTAVGACGCSPSSSVTVNVCTCPNGGCFLPANGCVGPASTCTVGADQSCNDNPAISSIHGRCIAGGRCACGSFGLSATSGKCR
jgi:hypothetical protein